MSIQNYPLPSRTKPHKPSLQNMTPQKTPITRPKYILHDNLTPLKLLKHRPELITYVLVVLQRQDTT